jgi:hypothetical protein
VINSYKNATDLELHLRDYRLAEAETPAVVTAGPPGAAEEEAAEEAGFRLEREQLAAFYRRLRAAQAAAGDASFRWEIGNAFPLPETEMLKVFFELGLARWEGGANPYRLKLPEQAAKKDLSRSMRFRYWNETK